MSKITAIRAARGRGKRARVFLDEGHALTLTAAVVLEEGLSVGQELTAARIEGLLGFDSVRRCVDSALRLLDYRPRSEFELETRLKRRFDDEVVRAALKRLKERSLVDDAEFARFWKDNRESFSPRSRRLVGLELRRKGVDGGTIDGVLRDMDDEENAYRAAMAKGRNLSRDDYGEFRRKLAGYLARRGFGYGVITRVVERVWGENV